MLFIMNERRYCLFFLLLILISWCGISASEHSANVLFIRSYTPRTPWQHEMIEGLRDGFRKSGIKSNIAIEYLDSDYWVYGSEKILMRRICERARKRGVDVIVTANDEALYTLLTCGDSLPHTTPVVFFGVKYPNYRIINKYTTVTGFTSNPDFNRMLRQAHHIFPNRKEVVCISDNSFLSGKGKEYLQRDFELFCKTHPGYQITMYNTQEKTTQAVVAAICNERNSAGRIVIVPKWSGFMSFLGKNSKAPFFTCQNLSLMNGVLCAYDADPYAASYLAGKRASAILKGGNPRDFGFSRTVSNFMYDYKQLDFFRVDVDKATPGMVINQPYWEKYQLLFILLYASVLALLVFVVVWLARINRREAKRRMHAQTRLLLQNRLVAQRDEFDHVFHSIRDGVITYDTDLRIHFTNHAMQKILHLNKEDLSRPFEGMPAGATIRLYNNGKEVLCELLRQVLDEGIGITIPENSFMQEVHSNDYFLVSGEIVPICLHGKVSGVAFSFRNVSDEEVQRRFFNLAIEESSVYPWQYNVHTGVFTFSQNFLKEIGFSEEHKMLSHQDMMELLHPDDLHAVRELFDKIIAGDSMNTRISFRQRNVQGEYEWWEYRVSVLNGPTQDMPYDVLGVCQNIQRYKSTEQALTAARDKALQADKLKTAFLANMSHEIRTPLNAIVGFSDLLTDMKNFTEEEVGQFIVTINKNCTLLLTLINDILDLSRIESGSMDFRFAPHNLLLLLKNVYDSQCLNMPEGVELLLDVPTDEKKYITTDSVRLQQVINNLINNAAKFTTSGSITFGYKIDAPGTVTLFVEDTGKGISDEAIRHIFERFYKADSFTQGAGLGLSICQTIVDRLHGTIGVTSEVNVGTRFLVKITDECA